MLFSKLPNLEYDIKPHRFPFSETEYVLAKNFFRRYKIDQTELASSIYFNKYTMTDVDRLDLLSQKFYNTTSYDWIILLTNNTINTLLDLPIKEYDLFAFVEEKYGVPDGIHHYETLPVKNTLGEIILKEGLIVDAVYASTNHKFYDRNNKTYFIKQGSTITTPVSHFEYEKKLNDKRREIFILRPEFIQPFISEFDEAIEYQQSGGYIDRKNKKSGL